jgi:DnaJ-domain-containing protein 1
MASQFLERAFQKENEIIQQKMKDFRTEFSRLGFQEGDGRLDFDRMLRHLDTLPENSKELRRATRAFEELSIWAFEQKMPGLLTLSFVRGLEKLGVKGPRLPAFSAYSEYVLRERFWFKEVGAKDSRTGGPSVADSGEESYYDVLGISETATEIEVKKAWRGLVAKYHPDRNSDPEAVGKMHRINAAYAVLSDVELRRQYDLTWSKR